MRGLRGSTFLVFFETGNIVCLLVAQMVKHLPTMPTWHVGDMGSIPGSGPGLGGSPGERNGNPLQHSYLGNPMNRGTWQSTVHGIETELDIT